jgi:hypothetical protein
LNKDQHWRAVFGAPENKRAKDEELIVRFLAMLDGREKYARPMAKFLNDYSAKMNKASPETLASLAEIFRQTIALVNKALDGRAFRPVRSLNAAVYDSVMVGIAMRLRKAPPPEPRAVAAAYDSLLLQPEHKRGWERATADEESVKARMAAAISAFDAL